MPRNVTAIRKATHQPRGALFSVTWQTVSLISAKVVLGSMNDASPISLMGAL